MAARVCKGRWQLADLLPCRLHMLQPSPGCEWKAPAAAGCRKTHSQPSSRAATLCPCPPHWSTHPPTPSHPAPPYRPSAASFTGAS